MTQSKSIKSDYRQFSSLRRSRIAHMRTHKLQQVFSNSCASYLNHLPSASRHIHKNAQRVGNPPVNLLPTSSNFLKSFKISENYSRSRGHIAIPSHSQPPQQQIVGWPAADRPDLHAPRGPRLRAPVPSYCRDAAPRAPATLRFSGRTF